MVPVSLLTLFAMAVQGFHPYAEDGGLYAAGIKKRIDPNLYAARPDFVLAHLRFTPFAGFVAWLTRASHLSLDWVLLALYGVSVWATLYAGWMLASRCCSTRSGRLGAVALLACWLTMPIAGTSLLLMDPYVTARSVSTPLTLLALAWALEAIEGSRRGAVLCGFALLMAFVHPLMATYALAAVVVLVVVSRRGWGAAILFLVAVSAAAMVQAWAPAESAIYVRAEMTRYYWFPLQWQWYELFGLATPLILLWRMRREPERAYRWNLLARSAVVLGLISLVVALLFARVGLATHLVARLQPLRCFQVVYEVLFLLMGGWLGERWLRTAAWRWGLMLIVLGGVMFTVQRQTYPASPHFELPFIYPRNPWVHSFVWARQNTPENAVFALDAHYITEPGEDAQGFRAWAERSALPDYSKDGGEASITPALASEWAAGVEAQLGIDQQSDAERAASLKRMGADWVLLRRTSATGWECPYENEAVKVCRIP